MPTHRSLGMVEGMCFLSILYSLTGWWLTELLPGNFSMNIEKTRDRSFFGERKFFIFQGLGLMDFYDIHQLLWQKTLSVWHLLPRNTEPSSSLMEQIQVVS